MARPPKCQPSPARRQRPPPCRRNIIEAQNHRPPAVEATVLELLPNARYRVRLGSGAEVLAHVAGAMRMKFVRILTGDKVMVELSPFDATKGRITLPI